MVKEPRKTGLVDGKFHACPIKHVCVSTMSSRDDKVHYIEPIKYDGNIEDIMTKIVQVVNSLKRTKILLKTELYLHVVFTTALFRFKDDVEFLINDEEKLIHFRSQSRIGEYDLNKNRNRMEKFRTLFNQ
ncbi:MAG: DUF1499 domain-containing protein [Candidatus Thorarchaeota archaeon]